MKENDGLVFGYVLDGNGGGQGIDWKKLKQWSPERGTLWLHFDYTSERVKKWLAGESRLSPDDVLHCLTDLFVKHGAPEHIRSDNGPEFTAKAVRAWLGHIGVKTLFIEAGSPWENGYNESFNGKLRDELLNGEIFYTLKEAKVMIERWRQEYNTVRPHSSLRYRPPAPETTQPRPMPQTIPLLTPPQMEAENNRTLT